MKVLTTWVLALLLVGSTVSVGFAATNSVTLRWTAPKGEGSAGRAYRYDIRYSTAPITDLNWGQAYRAPFIPFPDKPGTIQTCIVTGLSAATTYYFRMKTADEKYNWSALSNQISMRTCGGPCVGSSGNVDCSLDDRVDVSDLTTLINFLFLSGDPMCFCPAEANVDGDPLGKVDISDLSRLTDYLFISLKPLAPCPGSAGADQ